MQRLNHKRKKIEDDQKAAEDAQNEQINRQAMQLGGRLMIAGPQAAMQQNPYAVPQAGGGQFGGGAQFGAGGGGQQQMFGAGGAQQFGGAQTGFGGGNIGLI
mmetsp:Transcript_13251/g.11837  ORF Transcript_13251/g.11837 Transcript_13251/m.11837 type:complete len:102 (-) Transcript_13251:248-553(-)